MIGELITAGASLLGSLFGGGDEKTTSQINYKDMVKDAEAAGFNPLTAIRNGGSAGYVQTSHPGLSSGAFIADAIGKVGNIISNYDPMAKATADLEFKIKEETLRNLQADTAQRLRASVGGVPATAGATVVRSPGGMAPAKPVASSVPVQGNDLFGIVPVGPMQPVADIDNAKVGKMEAAGNPFNFPVPKLWNTQHVEDILGDDITNPAFWMNAPIVAGAYLRHTGWHPDSMQDAARKRFVGPRPPTMQQYMKYYKKAVPDWSGIPY